MRPSVTQSISAKKRTRTQAKALEFLLALAAFLMGAEATADESALAVDSHFANSNGVKIHYVTKGVGDPIVLIHGFPDYRYSWRDQIPALASNHRVIAIDQRGYNLSDQPESNRHRSEGDPAFPGRDRNQMVPMGGTSRLGAGSAIGPEPLPIV